MQPKIGFEIFSGKMFLCFLILLMGMIGTGCDQPSASQPPPAQPEVGILTLSAQPITLTSELPGRTVPCTAAEIRPQINGLVQKRLFTEGSDVQAGQVLYEIDPAPYQAAVDQAEANLMAMKRAVDQAESAVAAALADVARQQAVLELSRINRDRMETLLKDNIVPTRDVDQATTDVRVAEATLASARAQAERSRKALGAAEAAVQQSDAALKTARINLGYTTVKAPITGRIGRSSVTEGAVVTAYQPVAMAVIQQLDPIYVDVTQSTSELLNLKRKITKGQLRYQNARHNRAGLVLEDGIPYPLEGVFQFQDVTVDPTTHSVTLRMIFPNPDGLLMPGMFVRAVVHEGVHEHAILVPQKAVSRDPRGNPFSLVVDPRGMVQQRMLVIDRAVGNQWLVSSGLSAGQRMIVEGFQKVRPGDAVKTVSMDAVTIDCDTLINSNDPTENKQEGGA